MDNNENIIKDANRNILSCFSGEDGGVAFVKYRNGIVALAERADAGDINAIQICAIVEKFSKLIDVLNK